MTAASYMFDTNIFNRILDRQIDISILTNSGKNSYYATHIQIDEITNTKDVQRRSALLRVFNQISGTKIPTESFALNVSRLGMGKLSNGNFHDVLLSELNEAKPKEKENNIKDALIGETCIKNNITLVSTDGPLYNTVKKNGGAVLNLEGYLKEVRLN